MFRPDFAAHRAAVLERLKDDEAMLIFGGPLVTRNADADHRYRPHSDVWWLSGWPEHDVAVFLRPGEEPYTLFCLPRDPERETWTGRRIGPEGAVAKHGADKAFDIDELPKELARLLQGVRELHYEFGVDFDRDRMLKQAIYKAGRAGRRNGLEVPATFHAPAKLLHELRLLKNDRELEILRETARITGEAHVAAMQAGKPGAWEYELEAILDHTFRRQGGTGAGYTSIVAAGDNANILHYIENDQQVADGDLVLIDAGCEVGFYTADVTRTWPANGRFSDAQRAVYQAVLDAQLACIEATRPGATFMEVHDVAIRKLTEGMVALGLLEGEVDSLIEEEAFKKYYMHGTSHWLGLDVHDVGAYAMDGSSRVLKPGMLLTIEPGLYIPADDEDAPEHLRGIGVRIEDDVLVVEGGHEVITAGIPKTVAEVEAATARASA
jgi:Xaa-Pro aminopeptidase